MLAEVARYGGASPFVLPDSIPIEERPQYAALLSAAFAEKTLSTTAYSYDAQGRLVERTRRMGILSEERTRFEYDDRGNPILETTEHHDREIELDDTAGARSKNGQARVDYTRFEYQYDANGNWTERIVSFRSGSDTDFRRSNVERRTISYYRS